MIRKFPRTGSQLWNKLYWWEQQQIYRLKRNSQNLLQENWQRQQEPFEHPFKTTWWQPKTLTGRPREQKLVRAGFKVVSDSLEKGEERKHTDLQSIYQNLLPTNKYENRAICKIHENHDSWYCRLALHNYSLITILAGECEGQRR